MCVYNHVNSCNLTLILDLSLNIGISLTMIWVTFLKTWYVTMACMQGHMLQLRAIVYDQNLQVYLGSYGFERCELYSGSCDVKGCVVKQFVCFMKMKIMHMLLYSRNYNVFEMPQRQGKKVEPQQEIVSLDFFINMQPIYKS